ncbi:MAG: hypothetical protein ACTSO9_21710, partial [Candidatus Helarchaeota archaeon]
VHERTPETIPYFTSDELEHYTSALGKNMGSKKPFQEQGGADVQKSQLRSSRQSWSMHDCISVERKAKLRKPSRKSSLERKSKWLKRSENPPVVTR